MDEIAACTDRQNALMVEVVDGTVSALVLGMQFETFAVPPTLLQRHVCTCNNVLLTFK